MRRNGFGDPGATRDLADEPPGAVPVEPPPVRGQEHRAAGALISSRSTTTVRVCPPEVNATGVVRTLGALSQSPAVASRRYLSSRLIDALTALVSSRQV
jgi:hypothetical protein